MINELSMEEFSSRRVRIPTIELTTDELLTMHPSQIIDSSILLFRIFEGGRNRGRVKIGNSESKKLNGGLGWLVLRAEPVSDCNRHDAIDPRNGIEQSVTIAHRSRREIESRRIG